MIIAGEAACQDFSACIPGCLEYARAYTSLCDFKIIPRKSFFICIHRVIIVYIMVYIVLMYIHYSIDVMSIYILIIYR